MVYVRGGTYVQSTPSGPNTMYAWGGGGGGTGTAGNPIVFRNYNNEHVIIDCGGQTVVHSIYNCMQSPFANAPAGQWVTVWGFDFRNLTSTYPRYSESAVINVTNNSTAISQSVGSQCWVAGSECLDNSGDCSPLVGGQTGAGYIILGGVQYSVASASDCTHATLSSVYTGTSGTVVGTWFGYGTTPGWIRDIGMGAQGETWINCFFHDGEDINFSNSDSGVNGGGLHTFIGNYVQYFGAVGGNEHDSGERSHGHYNYVENPRPCGEACRTTLAGNVELWGFDVGIQLYGSNSDVSYITLRDNVFGPTGHGAAPTTTFPDSGPGNDNILYAGAGGTQATSPDSSTKVMYGVIIDHNITYGAAGSYFGGSKGSANTTITNNHFFQPNGISFLNNATFPPLTIAGNLFWNNPDDTGGPASTWTSANYPTNTFNSPCISYKQYYANPYETGRGHVAILNCELAATVQIDPAQMGGYAGEQWRAQNWQNVDPWNSSLDIATGIWDGVSLVTVSTTADKGVAQPQGLNQDGSAPLTPPADLGPKFVTIMFYPRWEPLPERRPQHTRTVQRTPQR
jgi:hypothetical protein